jgi:hypothetical protein
MAGLRPDLVRAETVRLLDSVLEGIADGRLDLATIRRLPPWRAAVLARIARRAGLMAQQDLDELTEEIVKAGSDGVLDPPPAPAPEPEPQYVDGTEWTKAGMIQKAYR